MITNRSLEVLFTPADFTALEQRDLRETVCVVFDVLRATTSMITALANGAKALVPVAEIPEALGLREKNHDLLLAGERDGVIIESRLTGSIAFDFGNSPREFTKEKVSGRTLAFTTTNGTRAIRACSPAKKVLIGSFLNLRATARFLRKDVPPQLLVVCSGTFDQASYEDILGAGALCDLLWSAYSQGEVADSAAIARRLFQIAEKDLAAAFAESRNGRRLLKRPDLREDVAFCAQRDSLNIVAELGSNGAIKARKQL